MTYYAIKILNRANRFIEWMTDTWFGTNNIPMYLWTKEEITDIFNNKMLNDYYIYDIECFDRDGNSFILSNQDVIKDAKKNRRKSNGKKRSLADLANL